MDYFELFNLPVSLKVNKAEVLQKYYGLSRQFHPDNFSLQDEKAQQHSLAMSARINEAKNILDDSYKRLEYVLRERNTITPDEKYVLSPIFLGEMMDINEKLAELDSLSESESLRAGIREEISKIENELYQEVEGYFESDDLQVSEADLSKLKDYYYKRKYLFRILDRLV